jgi:hypothetical protein
MVIKSRHPGPEIADRAQQLHARLAAYLRASLLPVAFGLA